MASTNTAATGDPGSAAPAAAAAGVLVILGASGDLTKRLLLPALYNLACDGLLPQDFTVVGMARSQLDTASFRAAQRALPAQTHLRQRQLSLVSIQKIGLHFHHSTSFIYSSYICQWEFNWF